MSDGLPRTTFKEVFGCDPAENLQPDAGATIQGRTSPVPDACRFNSDSGTKLSEAEERAALLEEALRKITELEMSDFRDPMSYVRYVDKLAIDALARARKESK